MPGEIARAMGAPAADRPPDGVSIVIVALAEQVVMDAVKKSPLYRELVGRVTQRITEERESIAALTRNLTDALALADEPGPT